MKRIVYLISVLAIVGTTACEKDEQTNTDIIATAVFDAAIWNTNATGLDYPVLVRKPIVGAPTLSSSFTLHSTSATIYLRVNLIGSTKKSDRTVGFKLFDVPINSIIFPATPIGQLPARDVATLTTAVADPSKHYISFGNSVIIPADSTWGAIQFTILNPGATPGEARTIGIALDDTGDVMPLQLYDKLAIAIDQR